MFLKPASAFAVLSTLGSLFGGMPAYATDLDPAAVVKSSLSGVAVDKIFANADRTISKAINEAQDSGNGLIIHAADQTSILEQDANLLIGDQRQKTFGQLNASEQNLLVEMEQWRRAASKLQQVPYDLVDTVNLDTSYQLEHLPFEPDFFVQSVHGVSFLKQPSDYKVTIRALNLGVQDGKRADITVLIDGKPVAIPTPDQSTLNQAIITLPNSALAEYFQPDHLRTVSLLVRVNLTKTSVWDKVVHFWGPVSTIYEVPVTLTLYPALAAKVTLEVHHPHYDWTSIGQVTGPAGARTPDKDGCTHSDGSCGYVGTVELRVRSTQQTPPVEGDQRIDSYGLDCISQEPWCPISEVLSQQLIENNSHAIIVYRTRSHSVQMAVRATAVSEYKRRAQDDVANFPMNVYFDHTSQVVVPGDFDALIAHVTTFSGKTYDFAPDTQPDPHGLVVKSTITPPPAPTRLVVLTADPTSVLGN